MAARRLEKVVPLSGVLFVILAVVGNALQGSTPAPHEEARAAAEFYRGKPLLIALGMTLSLLSLFFLASFLASLRQALRRAEGQEHWLSTMAAGGGVAAIALLAAGFALNSLGALRARAQGSIPPETAVVFYDGGLALTGLAAPLALAILLAPTAVVVLRSGVLPSWFGWFTVILAALGLIAPLSFILLLLLPVWVLAGSVLLYRRGAAGVPG